MWSSRSRLVCTHLQVPHVRMRSVACARHSHRTPGSTHTHPSRLFTPTQRCPHKLDSTAGEGGSSRCRFTVYGAAGQQHELPSSPHGGRRTPLGFVPQEPLLERLPASYTACMAPVHRALPEGWSCDEMLEGRTLSEVRRLEQARMDRLATRVPTPLSAPPTVIKSLPQHTAPGVLANGLLLVDKPGDWDCEEVARALRWALKLRGGVRLGYAGSLEPLASGLVVFLLGQAASTLAGALAGVPATYSGVVRLGLTTDTFDVCGRAVAAAPWTHITDDDIQAAGARLVGEVVQVPPAFNPAKLSGRPVYGAARRRPPDELEPRAVRITALSLERCEPGGRDVRLAAAFATPTYPRAVAHEVGVVLGCGAHLVGLRRESLGGFTVSDAWPLEVLLPALQRLSAARRRSGR